MIFLSTALSPKKSDRAQGADQTVESPFLEPPTLGARVFSCAVSGILHVCIWRPAKRSISVHCARENLWYLGYEPPDNSGEPKVVPFLNQKLLNWKYGQTRFLS